MQTYQHHPCGKRKASRGILLIEILVALAILAALAGLALPGFQGALRDYRLRVAAQDLASELGWAQAEALRRGGSVFLSFTPASECGGNPPPARTRCGWTISLGPHEPPLRTFVLPREVDIPKIHTAKAGNETIEFGPQGYRGSLGVSFVLGATGLALSHPSTRIICMGRGGRIRFAAGQTCPA